MVNIQAVSTVALTVPDIQAAQSFYTQALGFQVVGDITFAANTYDRLAATASSSVRLMTLQLGDEGIELIQPLDLTSEPIPEDSRSHDLWFQHLAIVVSDMDQAYEHLKPFDIQPISAGPQTIPADNPLAGGVRAFKFRDPDRQSLELIWFPSDKGKAKWQQRDGLFLGIDHTAIAIADLDTSLKFYRDLLGMDVVGSHRFTGNTQSALDNLPDAAVQVTPLKAADASLGVELLDYHQPDDSRPIPKNWDMSALAHMHIILTVSNLESCVERLAQRSVEIVSQGLIEFPQSYRYRRGCLVRDPDRHALLLVE